MRLFNVGGPLQNVEVLKIDYCELRSEELSDEEEWEVSEGVEFCSLRYLELSHLTLMIWKADDYSHFPRLRHLKIRFCSKLKEILTSIGETETLEMIEVDVDNPSLLAWAQEIQETQRSEYGNESLQIRIHPRY